MLTVGQAGQLVSSWMIDVTFSNREQRERYAVAM